MKQCKTVVVEGDKMELQVDLRGRSNLRNHYHPPLRAQRNGGGQRRPVYTLSSERTRSNALACASILRNMAGRKGRRAYLVTHTCGPRWDTYARRDMWRHFIDVIRKEHRVVAYLWATELHPGHGQNADTIHHHMVLVTDGRWNYEHRIQGWSNAYSGSPNGLQIDWIKPQHVGYPVKGVGYPAKMPEHEQELPFRWWGSSALQRKAFVRGPIRVHHVRYGWARVSYVDAAKLCAYATDVKAAQKARRNKARKQRLLRGRMLYGRGPFVWYGRRREWVSVDVENAAIRARRRTVITRHVETVTLYWRQLWMYQDLTPERFMIDDLDTLDPPDSTPRLFTQ